ncbi:MAG: DedA family protein [Nitrososphaerales archaeon]
MIIQQFESVIEALDNLSKDILNLIYNFGSLGVFLGMVLESSIVPIPSELVLIAAGAAGIDLLSIVIYGSLGSTIGSLFGWLIGFYGGNPIVKRFGKYVFIHEEDITRAENWFNKWGGLAIIISRLIPIIPYKVFSLTSGILGYDLKKFLIFTFIGTIPRTFLLGWTGSQIIGFNLPIVTLAVIILLAILIILIIRKVKKP